MKLKTYRLKNFIWTIYKILGHLRQINAIWDSLEGGSREGGRVAWKDLNFERGLLGKKGKFFRWWGGGVGVRAEKNKKFSVIAKKLNWEILTKNSVTFKRWDGLRMKNFDIMKGSLKNQIFEGGFPKNQYLGRNYLKGGGGGVVN